MKRVNKEVAQLRAFTVHPGWAKLWRMSPEVTAQTMEAL